MPSSTEVIDEIREQWRQRQAWHRAEKAITLQAKALCRRLVGGDKGEAAELFDAIEGGTDHPLLGVGAAAIMPLLAGREPIEAARKAIEKRLETLAKQLPAVQWVEPIRGLTAFSLAMIVGEAGDLSNYPTKGHLWKRMGLALMPDGTRQRRVTGDEAIAHGYSPSRRSVMWTIGDSMKNCQVRKIKDADGKDTGERTALGVYGRAYLDRKTYEIAREPEIAPIKAHRRAQRYMEKRLLRDLWQAWRREAARLESERIIPPLPRADDLRDAA